MTTRALLRFILVALLPVFASTSLGEGTSSDGEAVEVRVSGDGTYYLLGASTRCNNLGPFLLSKKLMPKPHVHLILGKDAEYEVVRSTLESLQHLGFIKIGFVNSER